MALEQVGLQWINEGLATFGRDVERGNDAMQGAGDAADSAANKINPLSGVITGVSTAITTFFIDAITKATQAVIGFATESVGMATEFESSATRLKIAGTGAASVAGIALDDLSESALKVGGDTRLLGVSATGAAESITELLKAGLSVDQVMGDFNSYMEEGAQLGGVLRGAIDLAAATELDMVEASSLAATSMTIFGFSADDVTKKLDYMVRGADASVADVSDLRDALEGAGPTLRGFGFTIEDSVDALSLLSNAGITGAQAGTAMRSAWTQLTSDKKKVVAALEEQGIAVSDAEGNFFSFKEVLGQLEIATKSMTQAQKAEFLQTIAGAYGKTALTALLDQGIEGYENYSAALENAAGIERQSAENAQTLASAQEALEGTIETLRIRVGSALLPTINTLTGVFSELVEKYSPEITAAFETIGAIMEQVSGYVIALVQDGFVFTDWLETLPQPIQNVVNAFLKEWPKIKNSVTRVFNGIKKVVNSVIAAIQPAIETLIETFQGVDIDNVNSGFEMFGDIMLTVANVVGTIFVTALGLVSAAFNGIVSLVNSVVGTWEEMIEALRSGDIVGAITTVLTGVFEAVWALISGFGEGFIAFFSELLGVDIIALWTSNWQMLVEIIQIVWGNIVEAVTVWWTKLQESFNAWLENIVLSWENTWNSIIELIKSVGNAIRKGLNDWLKKMFSNMGLNLDEMKNRWIEIWNDILLIVTTVWEIIVEWINEKFATIQETIFMYLEQIKAFWTEIWDAIVAKVQEVWEAIVSYVTEKMDIIKTFITENFLIPIQEKWNEIWDAVKKKVLDIWDGIVTGIGNKGGEVQSKVEEVIENVKEWLRDQYEHFVDLGHDLMMGLKDGIESAVAYLLQFVTKAIERVIDAAKEKLGIQSPSKVFFEIGENTMLGFAQAIQGSDMTGLGRDMAASFIGGVEDSLPVMPSAAGTTIDRSTSVEVNASYANVQSEAEIYYDVSSALAAANL